VAGCPEAISTTYLGDTLQYLVLKLLFQIFNFNILSLSHKARSSQQGGRQKDLILFGGGGGGGPFANFTKFEKFRPICVNIVCGQNFKGGGICGKYFSGIPHAPPQLRGCYHYFH